MTTQQFFIRRSHIDDNGIVTLRGTNARHIRLVLRLKKGGRIRLVDEDENLYTAAVEEVADRTVTARIVEASESMPASRGRLTIVQGIPRLPKTDLIVQKLTELGAESIIFAPTRRTPYTDGLERISKRLDRLRKIAESAARQCCRASVPGVDACAGLAAAQKALGTDTLLLVADENADERSLRDCLAGAGPETAVAVVIGPEGGLSPEEVHELEGMGALGFSLGRSILRTETAAIVAATIVLYEMGEI